MSFAGSSTSRVVSSSDMVAVRVADLVEKASAAQAN
jgi:hypothetical protein